jgi:hypothetical protein
MTCTASPSVLRKVDEKVDAKVDERWQVRGSREFTPDDLRKECAPWCEKSGHPKHLSRDIGNAEDP